MPTADANHGSHAPRDQGTEVRNYTSTSGPSSGTRYQLDLIVCAVGITLS